MRADRNAIESQVEVRAAQLQAGANQKRARMSGDGQGIADEYEADWKAARFSIADSDDEVGEVQSSRKRPRHLDDNPNDLLELVDSGEQGHWPEGSSEQEARDARADREAAVEPSKKRLRMAKPERERNTDSTLGVASARMELGAAVFPQMWIPPHQGWAFGLGHDLRFSDELV